MRRRMMVWFEGAEGAEEDVGAEVTSWWRMDE